MSAEFNKLMVSQSANALEVAELSEFIESKFVQSVVLHLSTFIIN